jgi:SAM-dependent methyltransferase
MRAAASFRPLKKSIVAGSRSPRITISTARFWSTPLSKWYRASTRKVQHCPAEQVAYNAETEEQLESGDVVGRRGRVATHDQSAGNIDERKGAKTTRSRYRNPATLPGLWVEVMFPPSLVRGLLPFAAEFFDAIVCIDCFSYFGTDDLYLNYLARFVKPGSQVGIAGAGLMREIEGSPPEHLGNWWTQDLWCLHSADWWRQHFGWTGTR